MSHEWRYLLGGTRKHALRHATDAAAHCGIYTLPASEWRGTGNQAEYETVNQLQPCANCLRAMGRTE